jgi:hypothetical protein
MRHKISGFVSVTCLLVPITCNFCFLPSFEKKKIEERSSDSKVTNSAEHIQEYFPATFTPIESWEDQGIRQHTQKPICNAHILYTCTSKLYLYNTDFYVSLLDLS